MVTDLKRIIDQICRDKGIERHVLIETLEEAVKLAVRKKYGQLRDLEVKYNDELGEIEVFQFHIVVDKVKDEQTEILLSEALELDQEAQIGDGIGTKMDNIADLGRIAAQSAKQVIIQKMKDAERDVIHDMFKDRKGEIVNGIVQRFERGNIIVNLGRTDAILPVNEQIPRKSFRQGDRIRAYLLDVRKTTKDPQLVLSRTHTQFLNKLFTLEVPEIAEGIVQIMGTAREPGLRAKIAVASRDSDVDPVGACVGMKGSRVQNVVQELQGERIDIVPWSPDPAKYVSNALAPAQVTLVSVDEANKSLLVVVPDDQLSLAIGRQGQNVRLASRLLEWKIDVKSETNYSKLMQDDYQSLVSLPGMDEKTAEILYKGGLTSLHDLAEASIDDLSRLPEIDPEWALHLIHLAQKHQQEEQQGETDSGQGLSAE